MNNDPYLQHAIGESNHLNLPNLKAMSTESFSFIVKSDVTTPEDKVADMCQSIRNLTHHLVNFYETHKNGEMPLDIVKDILEAQDLILCIEKHLPAPITM